MAELRDYRATQLALLKAADPAFRWPDHDKVKATTNVSLREDDRSLKGIINDGRGALKGGSDRRDHPALVDVVMPDPGSLVFEVRDVTCSIFETAVLWRQHKDTRTIYAALHFLR